MVSSTVVLCRPVPRTEVFCVVRYRPLPSIENSCHTFTFLPVESLCVHRRLSHFSAYETLQCHPFRSRCYDLTGITVCSRQNNIIHNDEPSIPVKKHAPTKLTVSFRHQNIYIFTVFSYQQIIHDHERSSIFHYNHICLAPLPVMKHPPLNILIPCRQEELRAVCFCHEICIHHNFYFLPTDNLFFGCSFLGR